MRRDLAICGILLVLGFFLGGCTALKKTAKVLGDPSIQVGELQDQPSQVALSVLASPGVNPSLYPPVEAPSSEEQTSYRVNLSGNDLNTLTRQLLATLEVLEKELASKRRPDASALEAMRQQMQVDAQFSHEPVGLASEASGGDEIPRAVGQYREGANPLQEVAPSPEALARTASPVALKVFQLKDNGVFLGADAEALEKNPEKALGKTYLDHDEFVLRPDEFKFVRFFPVKPNTQFIGVVAAFHETDGITWKAVHRIEPVGGKYPLLVSLDEHGVKIKSED